jgi:hypothetical protein
VSGAVVMGPEQFAPRLAARVSPGDLIKSAPGLDEDPTPTDECAALLRRLGIPPAVRSTRDMAA